MIVLSKLTIIVLKKRYEIRLIAVRPHVEFELETHNYAVILDWRHKQSVTEITAKKSLLIMKNCPTNWDDLRSWYKKAVSHQQQLVIAWKQPQKQPISDLWLTLVGIAKYLSRTSKPVSRLQLLEKLGISDQSLYLGFQGLKCLGFIIKRQENNLQIIWDSSYVQKTADHTINQFLAAVREEQFQRDYFFHVPLSMIVSMMRK